MALLVEFTPVFSSTKTSQIIKKAWKPGFVLNGVDGNNNNRMLHTLGHRAWFNKKKTKRWAYCFVHYLVG